MMFPSSLFASTLGFGVTSASFSYLRDVVTVVLEASSLPSNFYVSRSALHYLQSPSLSDIHLVIGAVSTNSISARLFKYLRNPPAF
jgi:hypothetical protein